MEKKNFTCSDPVLKRSSKRWYFEFYYTLPGGVRKRIKVSAGINFVKDLQQREELCKYWLDNFWPEKYLHFPSTQKRSDTTPLPDKIYFYIEQHRHLWKKRTQDAQEYQLGTFSQWLLMYQVKFSPGKFSSDYAMSFMRYLMEEKKVSTTTSNHFRATLFTMFKRWKIRDNPFEDVHRYPENKTPKKAFTPEQTAVLRAHIAKQDPRLHLYLGFIIYTFLRPNEIKHARVRDIDFNTLSIYVTADNSKTNRRRKHRIPRIFLPQVEFLKEVNPEYYIFGVEEEPGPSRIGRDRFASRMRKLLDQLGYSKEYSVYSWRHTAAIDFYKQCGDIRMVQQAMGHTTVTTTEKYLRNFGVMDDDRLLDRNEL